MDVRHLQLLRELSVRGTLAAVADATHRTPSALSQQLRTAERDLGVALVAREGRGLRLTAEGRLLAEAADEVGAVVEGVRARLEELRGEPAGVVRVGTLTSAGEALLPGLLAELEPGRIRVLLDDVDVAEADYAALTLDADVVIGHSLRSDVPAGAEGLVSRVVAREPIDVALPEGHRLAARRRLEVADLAGTRWIGVPEGYPFDSVLVAVEQLLGEPLTRVQRVRDNRLVEALVLAGQGLALLPRFTTRPRPGVVTRPLTGVRADRAVVALARADRYARPAVRAVVDALERAGSRLG